MSIKYKGVTVANVGGGAESSGGIPSGGIIIWSGAADAIPDGWVLCDGTNGTPDLRDKFVLGAGSKYTEGSTGGAETVTLTVEQMPEHTHKHIAPSVTPLYVSTSTSAGTGRNPYVSSANTFSESAGSSQPHPNMPPYYTLCYIMKK